MKSAKRDAKLFAEFFTLLSTYLITNQNEPIFATVLSVTISIISTSEKETDYVHTKQSIITLRESSGGNAILTTV